MSQKKSTAIASEPLEPDFSVVVTIKQPYPFTLPTGKIKTDVLVEEWDGYGVRVSGAFGIDSVYKALKKAGGDEWAAWVRGLPRRGTVVPDSDGRRSVPVMAFFSTPDWVDA